MLHAQIDNISNKIFEFEWEGHTVALPYHASHNIDEENFEIKRIIIVVHGTNRNADDYFDNISTALSKRAELVNETFILAPQFLTEEDIDAFDLNSDYPYWSSDGWKVGSNSRNDDTNPRDYRIPSYQILDSLILHLASTFSEVENLVFTGHSAGGQLTNRYTASSPIFQLLCDDFDLSSKSIIANPGNYVYFSPRRRVVGTTDQFEVPNGCDEYNEYSYGLEDLYTYHRQAGATQMKDWYTSREVIYLLGELDNDPNASTLPRSCRAMLQGDHRLERGLTYYNHIVDTFGEEVKNLHQLELVPGVGHNNFDIYNSVIGLKYLFDEPPILSCKTTTATEDISSSSIKLFPNPASQVIQVSFFDFTTNFSRLEIFDTTGRLQVKRQLENAQSMEVNVSDLSNGLYFLRIYGVNEVVQKSFIKI